MRLLSLTDRLLPLLSWHLPQLGLHRPHEAAPRGVALGRQLPCLHPADHKKLLRAENVDMRYEVDVFPSPYGA